MGTNASILFLNDWEATDSDVAEPQCFVDLGLDQVASALISGFEEYNLRPLFHQPLTTTDAVAYRHEVMRDLERAPMTAAVLSFSESMRGIRNLLAGVSKMHYRRQKQSYFLEAAREYVEATEVFAKGLTAARPVSRGLLAFSRFLSQYVKSEPFDRLRAQSRSLYEGLGAIEYTMLILPGRIEVRRPEGEADYSHQIRDVFTPFRHGELPPDPRRKRRSSSSSFREAPELNHVEAAVLDRVALLFADTFASLDRFCAEHRDFLPAVVADFDRGVQFYLAWRRLQEALARAPAPLPFCYPEFSDDSGSEAVSQVYDLALALAQPSVVCNDYDVGESERVLVITGPNQGGKTTFAKAIGQLHYLARLGLPVPARGARVIFCDGVHTHFERPENLDDARGKLEDDLLRMRDVLEHATERGLLVLNEVFTSTTYRDALFLSRQILDRIDDLGCLALCVTFLDDLAFRNSRTVSLVAGVAPDNPTVRTFRIERRPADGRAYAAVIAEKYGLDERALAARLSR